MGIILALYDNFLSLYIVKTVNNYLLMRTLITSVLSHSPRLSFTVVKNVHAVFQLQFIMEIELDGTGKFTYHFHHSTTLP